MNPKTIRFTKEAYEKLQTDLNVLIERRKTAVISLRTAREMGDLSENGAYKAARFELNDTDREIRRLTKLIRFGYVAQKQQSQYVDFGSTVTLSDGKSELHFMLVDGFESNPKEQKLSLRSPIGKAILRKKVGDQIEVQAPVGTKTYTILHIE